MEISQNDLLQKQILQEIAKREQILKATYQNVKKLKEENKLFEDVLDDYNNYFNYIITEKEKQYASLKLIKEYLDDLVNNTSIMREKSFLLKNDQLDILHALTLKRQEIEELIK